MADSLLDLYLGSGEKKIEPEKEQSSSLIDLYLAPSTPASTVATPAGVPRITVTPRVPISDNPVEQQQFEQSLADRQPEKSLAARAMALPVDAAAAYGSDVYRHASNAGQMFAEGIGEMGSNKPLGIGKAILGAAGVPLSLVTAPIEEATNFGDKITGKATPGLPTDIAGNPLSNKPFEVAGPTGMALSGLPVGKALSAIGKNAVALAAPAYASKISNAATKAIIDTIGPENLHSTVQELKSNPRLSLMDVVPATRQFAQKLITDEGPHQNKFEKFVTNREATAKNTLANITENNLGVPVSLAQKLDNMKAAAREVGSKEIEPAVASAGQVNVGPVVKNIDDILKPGVNSVITQGKALPFTEIKSELKDVRDLLTNDKIYRTDPGDLHLIQSGLRARADDLLNSTTGRDRQIGKALMDVRNNIVDAIDKSSDGKYKPALAKYRDEMQIQNAFNMGQLITKNKLGRLEDTPEFWENWTKSASKEELQSAREGARLAIYHQIKAFKAGARKTEDIVEAELNVEKLKSLFGEKEINTFEKLLKDERNIAVTNQKLIHNSQTAMREKADSRIPQKVTEGLEKNSLIPYAAEALGILSTGYPSIGAAGYMVANAAKKRIVNPLINRGVDAQKNAMTDLLTSTGPERDELIRILESHLPQPKLSIANRARLALPTRQP